MKKVGLFGKKVMSWGLAASLLVAPVSTNNCSAQGAAKPRVEMTKAEGKDSFSWGEIIIELIKTVPILFAVGAATSGYSWLCFKCLAGKDSPEFTKLKEDFQNGKISKEEFYSYATDMTKNRQQRHLQFWGNTNKE